jgi:hypothetical protein
MLASGGQGALFEKTAPWTPAKTFVYFHTLIIVYISISLAGKVTGTAPAAKPGKTTGSGYHAGGQTGVDKRKK